MNIFLEGGGGIVDFFDLLLLRKYCHGVIQETQTQSCWFMRSNQYIYIFKAI